MAVLKKGARITGSERTKLATDLRKAYDKGKSIRELADSHGRSYGFVHRVLSESGVTLRGRGGATRTKAQGRERWTRSAPAPPSRSRPRPGSRQSSASGSRPSRSTGPTG